MSLFKKIGKGIQSTFQKGGKELGSLGQKISGFASQAGRGLEKAGNFIENQEFIPAAVKNVLGEGLMTAGSGVQAVAGLGQSASSLARGDIRGARAGLQQAGQAGKRGLGELQKTIKSATDVAKTVGPLVV